MSNSNRDDDRAVPKAKPELTDTPELTEEEKAAAESPTIEGAPEVTDIDKDSQGLP
jgi:hypothetical protein